MEVEALIDTMLHELVHIEIGPHNDKFYDMLEEVGTRRRGRGVEEVMQSWFVASSTVREPSDAHGTELPVLCLLSCGRSATTW